MYYILREFADSWGLLFLFVSFLFIMFMVFRPSAKAGYERASRIPLSDDEVPEVSVKEERE